MILDPNFGRILLQLVLWLPLVGAVVVALAGSGPLEASPESSGGHDGQATARLSLRAWRIATAFAAITFLLAAWLFLGFDRARPDQ